MGHQSNGYATGHAQRFRGPVPNTNSIFLLDEGAVLTLSGTSPSGAANLPVTVEGNSTVNVNAANVLNTTGVLTLGGTSGAGTYRSPPRRRRRLKPSLA